MEKGIRVLRMGSTSPVDLESREVSRLFADVELRAAELRLAVVRLETAVALAVVEGGASYERIGELAYRVGGGRKGAEWARKDYAAAVEDYARYGFLTEDTHGGPMSRADRVMDEATRGA